MKTLLFIGTVALCATLTFPVVMDKVCPRHEVAIGGRVIDFVTGRTRRERRQQRRSEGRGMARLVGRAC